MNSKFQKIIANIKAVNNNELEGCLVVKDTFHLNKEIASIGEISHEDIVAIAEAFKFNNVVKYFTLKNFRLRDKGAEVLADMLKANNYIKHLSLTGSEITAKGAKALGRALQVNTTLENLDLDDNLIGDEGVGLLMDALAVRDEPISLELKNCLITDKGASMLADGLKNNKFSRLDLDRNEITDIGAILLANSLLVNSTQNSRDDMDVTLCIRDNLYTFFGSKALKEANRHIDGSIFYSQYNQDGAKEKLQVSEMFGTTAGERYENIKNGVATGLSAIFGSGDNE